MSNTNFKNIGFLVNYFGYKFIFNIYTWKIKARNNRIICSLLLSKKLSICLLSQYRKKLNLTLVLYFCFLYFIHHTLFLHLHTHIIMPFWQVSIIPWCMIPSPYTTFDTRRIYTDNHIVFFNHLRHSLKSLSLIHLHSHTLIVSTFHINVYEISFLTLFMFTENMARNV